MKTKNEIKQIARRTLQIETESIQALIDFIDDDFAAVVQLIFQSKGRVVITGIGKSAIIAQKIVATLNSTGTPAVFMHAADAIHGDLGTIAEDDIVIAISKSGNTPEVKVLVPLIKNLGNILIALCGNTHSYLAEQADWVLNTTVEREACPNNLAPTNSTTAQLAMGDALAVSLIECRSFGEEDFARFHPGGTLGKRLYLRVADIYVNNERPAVAIDAPLQQVIIEISGKRLGITAVLDGAKVVGVITDGDLRRMLRNTVDLSSMTAMDIMTTSPKKIAPEAMAVEALQLLEANNIMQLIVEEKGKYLGVIHTHDLLKEGII